VQRPPAQGTTAQGENVTSATTRTRTRTRISTATLVGLAAAALALTGCSSNDSDSGSGGASDTPSASSSASAGGGSQAGGSLDGSWVAGADSKIVALAVHDGQAGFFDSSGTTCTGTTGTEQGTQTIHLTCANGDKDRSDGTVESVDASTLKVNWKGLGEETYTKTQGGQLPSGLPTAGLPSGVASPPNIPTPSGPGN
jgi:hypothetical protein